MRLAEAKDMTYKKRKQIARMIILGILLVVITALAGCITKTELRFS